MKSSTKLHPRFPHLALKSTYGVGMEAEDAAGGGTPEQVLALITLVESSGWPTAALEQDSYFQKLGLRQLPGAPQEGAPPAVVGGVVADSASTTPIGSWMTHEGELVGISLFFQDEQDRPHARTSDLFGYIHSLIRRKYGEPLDDTVEPSGNASALWKVRGTAIELYRHVKPSFAIQVGLNNIERASARNDGKLTGTWNH
ncbi:hypothetical protein [Arthrobacter sp. FW306-07-I]|uniref:hypothetical protein n=1 Tax=Arthrobacter sp. FW306-07-I TaxID=2879622 RepID=UPI001F40EBD2|nr:hypothetical protein [Arthrobacter sp. FW306-07-I]UKA75076.1 hypothetical protein LFT46_18380 [Arthrobacter sp. FW306-07-I]